jgi:hypothetical protein
LLVAATSCTTSMPTHEAGTRSSRTTGLSRSRNGCVSYCSRRKPPAHRRRKRGRGRRPHAAQFRRDRPLRRDHRLQQMCGSTRCSTRSNFGYPVLSSTWQSPTSPVKLLIVLNGGDLGSWRSTAELLPRAATSKGTIATNPVQCDEKFRARGRQRHHNPFRCYTCEGKILGCGRLGVIDGMLG